MMNSNHNSEFRIPNSELKLRMQTANKADENFRKLAAMFPNAVTETINENGEVVRAIDKDVLMQEISCTVVDGNEERYQFTWPDKKKSVLLANAPINKTLRPVREDETVPTGADSEGKPYCSSGSVNFDTTENLYIEGDNLEVLKLLQETYLGKIKMIYIDPPYNTGNDFVYEDDFAQSTDEYLANSGQFDEEGNRMVQNTESNGRFHTDWLNMIYPRLKLAKDLLTDDGVMFISIADNEVHNLIKNCNEVFGEQNCLGIITWAKKRKGSFLSKKLISLTEYCVVYSKNSENVCLFGGKAEESESQPIIKRTNPLGNLSFKANTVSTKLQDGVYIAGTYGEEVNPVILKNDIKVENGIIVSDFVLSAHFVWSQSFLDNELKKGGRIVINTINLQPRVFRVYDDDNFKGFGSFVNGVSINGTNEDAYEELDKIFGVKKLFDYSKPKNYIKELIKAGTNFDKDCIVLDFFSGSSSTAHAVMQLNAEDGGHRKFIMVQLPEVTDEKSEAYKAGYKNICEIGKERIRRAGKKLAEQIDNEKWAIKINGVTVGTFANAIDILEPKEKRIEKIQEQIKNVDVGFRVLKCDTSNMKEVYYNPAEYEASLFSSLEDNIKEDRTPEDLLFQVMLDLGILLSSKIQVRSEEVGMRSYSYFDVEDGYLIACFDKNIDEEVIQAIAKQKPYYFVMRDSSMANDSVATNFDQIFSTYSPETVRKVL